MMQDKAPTLCHVGASSQNQKGSDSIFGLYVASPPEKMDKELTDYEVFVNSLKLASYSRKRKSGN